MADFYTSLSNVEIATQIAGLLNQHNRLTKKHNTNTILYSDVNYFVEMYGDMVVGCVASEKKGQVTLIKHVSVAPNFRGRDIATKLINLAIRHCDTDYVYMTIRADNVPSLWMAVKLNFMLLKIENVGDHNVITVGRKK